MKTKAELDAEIAAFLATSPPGDPAEIARSITEYRQVSAGRSGSARSRRARPSGDITGAQAIEMPRFEFIAHWLVTVTRKKERRGPLGIQVRRAGKKWRVLRGDQATIVYETDDPGLLFDYVRRTQLGTETRAADNFRADAYEAKAKRAQ